MINKEAAKRIWDLLVADLDVYERRPFDEMDDRIHAAEKKFERHERDAFVHAVGQDTCTEYRIGGVLGFGGKFRPQRWTVDCYPEDETPALRKLIDATNEKLHRLRGEFP